LILCVDIGGTSTKAGILHPNGKLNLIDSILSKPDCESYFDSLCSLMERIYPGARQIGVGVAGFLDEGRTHLVYNSNLPWLEGFPLRQRLAERYPRARIELEIDSNAATMAEYRFGSGRGKKRFLCLTCGTGLGVGMTIDGVPLRFAYGCMGDIGHTIVQRDGRLCSCGGRGCAEVLISATTLAAQYQELTERKETTLRDVIEASQAGDELATGVLTSAGEWLGLAAASMANAFFPDHIAIAGGLSAAAETVLVPAERMFRQTASALARSSTTFQKAELSSTASLIGAGWPFWDDTKV
jgi:glucokinase